MIAAALVGMDGLRVIYCRKLAGALRIAVLFVGVAITSQAPFALIREMFSPRPELIALVRLLRVFFVTTANVGADMRLLSVVSSIFRTFDQATAAP